MEYDWDEVSRQILNQVQVAVDAQEKRDLAYEAFKKAYARAANSGYRDIDEITFKEIIIDADTILPAMTGVWVPRVLMLRAWCSAMLFEADFQKVIRSKDPNDEVGISAALKRRREPHPLKQEARKYASVACEMFQKLGADDNSYDISMADFVLAMWS